ncbi:MAG: XrtA/PEP-CTERM system-associated ATPase [Sphingomonadales bacterium]
MSYTDHFGLSEAPFALTPDPRFWFESATHKKAMSYLGYGLAQAEGFIVVTGEIGAGKTTLVGLLMERIDPTRVATVRLASTQVDGDDLLRLVAQGFGLPVEGAAKAQLLDRIERYLVDRAREGRKTLLIVDEAQNLPHSALEELRMLSNYQSAGKALVQILLLGQPEFRERLASPALEQLRQRVIATHHLDGMTANEVRPYLEHRLDIVGWTGTPCFDQSACEALFAASDGIPRRINQLATRILLLAALDGRDVIDGANVDSVVADLKSDAAPVEAGAAGVLGAQTDNGPGLRRDDTQDRISRLEQQIEAQEAALRRVLTLMIDWVERDAAQPTEFARARPA